MTAPHRDPARHGLCVPTVFVVLLGALGLTGMLAMHSLPVAPQEASPSLSPSRPQVPTVWFTQEHVRLSAVLRTCPGTLYYRRVLTTQPLQCFDRVTFGDLKEDLTLVCLPTAHRAVLGVPDCDEPAGDTP
jgi:hypothetical protein